MAAHKQMIVGRGLLHQIHSPWAVLCIVTSLSAQFNNSTAF